MRFHALHRELLTEDVVELGPARDHTNVNGIPLVTGTAVRDAVEHGFHASLTSTRRCGSISLRSIRAGQYATTSCACGRPPAKPVTLGGPVRISGAISRVNASTGARSAARTATRSSTSGMSVGGGPAR